VGTGRESENGNGMGKRDWERDLEWEEWVPRRMGGEGLRRVGGQSTQIFVKMAEPDGRANG
jgi:hypothetical protein